MSHWQRLLTEAGAVLDFQSNNVVIHGKAIPFCQAKYLQETKKSFHESDCLLALTCNSNNYQRNKLKDFKRLKNKIENNNSCTEVQERIMIL